MILGQTNRKRPLVDIPMINNSFIDKSHNKWSVSNNSVASGTGIWGQSNGSGDYGTSAQFRWLNVNQQAGKDYLTASNTSNGSTAIIHTKTGTDSESSLNISFNVWGFSTSTWGMQLWVAKTTDGNRISIQGRNSTNSTGFGIGTFEPTQELTKWNQLQLRFKNVGAGSTYINFGINSILEADETDPETFQVPSTTEFLIGRRTDSASNIAFNGNQYGFRIYSQYLNDSVLLVLNKYKGRIKA